MMRIPTRLLEHPIEAAIASILLLTLLIGSADIKQAPGPEQTPANAVAEKV
jgi:hypothetical protein